MCITRDVHATNIIFNIFISFNVDGYMCCCVRTEMKNAREGTPKAELQRANNTKALFTRLATTSRALALVSFSVDLGGGMFSIVATLLLSSSSITSKESEGSCGCGADWADISAWPDGMSYSVMSKPVSL